VIDVREVVDRIDASDSLIVDARSPEDFASGHLPDALNLPAAAGIDLLKFVSKDWKHSHCIVVYCASDRCDLAKLLANRLLSEGFTNLLLFRGGWQEWVRSRGRAGS
jgi:rhodanese-related sulfurtransferase